MENKGILDFSEGSPIWKDMMEKRIDVLENLGEMDLWIPNRKKESVIKDEKEIVKYLNDIKENNIEYFKSKLVEYEK